MKQSFECANLEFDYNYASGSAFTQSMTYSTQIDLIQVLGPMYNKYDYFIIYFNSIGTWCAVTSYSAGTAVSLNATAMWTLGVSGLSWYNVNYNGNPNNLAFFPDRFTLPINNYSGYNSGIQSGLVFRKSNPIVNLSISPYLVRTGSSANAVNTANGGYDINLSFTIYGLYDD